MVDKPITKAHDSVYLGHHVYADLKLAAKCIMKTAFNKTDITICLSDNTSSDVKVI